MAGCDAAGISLRSGDTFFTAALTANLVNAVDSSQYRHGDGPCLTAMWEATVITVADFTDEPRWSDVARDACAAGVRSSLSVPFRDGERVLGGLNMYARDPHAFSAESRHIAEVIGRHGGLALRQLERLRMERVQRDVEHRITETLQRSLLPIIAPVQGLSFACRYLVSSHAAEVGGDWYDAFELPGGAVGVAIGDVMGHDIVAAAAMGQLRSVLRAYAYEGSTPAVVLDRMDRLVQGFDLAQVATALYARLILDRDGALKLYSNAGHLPPLVQYPDGRVVRLDGAPSRLLGAPMDGLVARSEAAVTLPVGRLSSSTPTVSSRAGSPTSTTASPR